MILKKVKNILDVSYDILRGVNQTVWGGAEGAKKAATVVKNGITGADVVIGTSHALEDAACGDYVCMTIDVIGSISSAVGLVLGNIPATKQYGVLTGSITVSCRTIRWCCKNHVTFWSCTATAGKEISKFVINKLK